MLEVVERVVDRRRCEHEHALVAGLTDEVVELVVARPGERIVGVATLAGVAEVVGLVDHHCVGQLGDPLEPLGVLQRSGEVGVAEHRQVGEVG